MLNSNSTRNAARTWHSVTRHRKLELGCPMAGESPPATKTILLADDDPAVRRLVRLTLSAALRCEILEAENGREALALARLARPFLVILDVQMPELDGYAVCRTLKADPATREMFVLMLTGESPRVAEPRSRAAGADGFISKPFSPRALRERVEALAGG
jgi:CheY-like chemotaxis protein